MKPRIAIYDFTDCEGCQAQLVSLREKLLLLEKQIDIVDWRMGQDRKESGPFFASIVEGTPLTQHEIDILKELRGNSKYLIALGACASLAGIPGIVKKEERRKWYEKIYGKKYKPRGLDALPLQAFVKVDFFIQGCPIDQEEIVRIFEEILSGKQPSYRGYSVCFECKIAENQCRILNKKPCLGPITQGGCKAVCISGGSACYGCFGFREESNIAGLLAVIEKFASKKEIEKYFSMFLRQMPEYKSVVEPALKLKSKNKS